jgi:hypothetical protein
MKMTGNRLIVINVLVLLMLVLLLLGFGKKLETKCDENEMDG